MNSDAVANQKRHVLAVGRRGEPQGRMSTNGGRGNEESPWEAGSDCSFVQVQCSAAEYCRSSPHFYREKYCGVCGCSIPGGWPTVCQSIRMPVIATGGVAGNR
jgi:hypothetical protein